MFMLVIRAYDIHRISFWATFVPLSLLCLRSYSFSNYSRLSMMDFYGGKFLSLRSAQNHVPTTSTSQIQMTPIGKSMMSVMGGQQSSSYVLSAQSNKSKWRRKSILLLVATIFAVYGITALSLVLSHFDKAIPYCSSVVNEVNDLLYNEEFNINTTTGSEYIVSGDIQQRLTTNSELFLFDYCQFPVYPFGSDSNGNIQCECRKFSNSALDGNWNGIWTIPELEYYFGINLLDILSGVLSHWKMLEKLEWRNTKTTYRRSESHPPLWNLTNDMFGASKLRILRISDTPSYHIGDAISNWRSLEFFEFDENDGFPMLPETIGQLQNLGFIDISEASTLTQFPEQLCNISSLRGIDLDLTGITTLPQCVADLPNLRSLSVSGTHLESIPLRLFTHSSLEEIVAVKASLNLASMISDNHFSNFSAFDLEFAFVSDKIFWFSYNPFCDKFYAGQIANDSNFYQFIENTGCCFIACDASSPFEQLQCYPLDYNDGLCDGACNSSRCHFDGGDCVQLCKCDAFTELGNGECNMDCNTTNCLYDGGDCLPSRFNASVCEQTYDEHGCNVSWVGDGWCDLNCLDAQDCGYDLDDCSTDAHSCGDGESNCYNFYEAFGNVANSQSNDDHISLNELQAYWPLLVQLGAVTNEKHKNASYVIKVGDLNQDLSLNMYETGLVLHAEFGISAEKAMQITCASCVGDEKYWN